MSKKKQAQEELIKTHVLNLNEIREVEKQDQKARKQKVPIVFFIIGIILVIIGIIYSIILTNNNKQETKKNNESSIKDKLTCIANLKDDVFNVNIHTETIYTFKNNQLLLSQTTSTTDTINTNDNNTLMVIQMNIINGTYGINPYTDPSNGVSVSMSILNNTLNINSNIDYTKFTQLDKQTLINNYLQIPTFTNKNSYEEVKKESEKKGALCN